MHRDLVRKSVWWKPLTDRSACCTFSVPPPPPPGLKYIFVYFVVCLSGGGFLADCCCRNYVRLVCRLFTDDPQRHTVRRSLNNTAQLWFCIHEVIISDYKSTLLYYAYIITVPPLKR